LFGDAVRIREDESDTPPEVTMSIERDKREVFVRELVELCKRHGYAAVPTFESQPSAHDPMHVVKLDDFWHGYLTRRLYVIGEDE
jgi:hypothetical protein